MSKGFASSYRIVLLATGLFACFGLLGVRLVWLHVVDRDALLLTITEARQQLIVETARRGDILDARGAILATSRSLIVLGVDPTSLRPQDEENWPQLAQMIGMPEAELLRIFTTRFYAPAASNPAPAVSPAGEHAGTGFDLRLPPAAASHPPSSPALAAVAGGEGIKSALDRGADKKGPRAIRWVKLSDEVTESLFGEIEKLGIRGVYGQRVYRRTYPNNQLAAHLIGYVDRQQQAIAGMEFQADLYLRGQNGWRVGERDGRQRELAQFRTREVPRADGYSVSLSIDSAVQDIVEQELALIAQRFQPRKATIIVSDPRTGFILGLGNYPSFNLNECEQVAKEEKVAEEAAKKNQLAEGEKEPARTTNVAVADIYEPGSVFKIVATAAALEEGLVKPGTKFNCALDKVEFKGRTLKLPGEDHRFEHDELTVAEIISRSSNRGAARLGLELGADRLYRYATAFGFGSPLGFPVGGEVGGILRRPEKWKPIDITRIPIGHTIAATALQMHQAMSVIASGGVLFRPQITRQIRDASGETVFLRKDGVEIRRVLSERTAQTMAAMLMGVTSKQGTAPEAAIDGFETAGKTGTTIKLIDGKYDSRHHVASFVGFFPATRPRVVISVIVDDADARAPGGVAYGKTVAAPSFKRIGEQLIPILGIKSNRPPVRPAGLVAASEGGRR